MKRILISGAVLAAALSAASCQGQLPNPGRGTALPVAFTVSIQGTPGTRATGTSYADESRVNSLQVFVFDETGALEDYKDAGTSMTATLTATSGERTVWALVNAPSLPEITTLEQLTSRTSLLSDNAPDGFVMSGSVTQAVVDGGTVPVTVKRIVSRVSVGKISSDFKFALADVSVQIDGIYLINVAADSDYATASASPVNWVNRLGHHDPAYDALLADRLTGVTVRNGSPYEQEHAFYPYPNAERSGIFEDTWSPRRSLLVIEVTFDGRKGYYPIELPVLERNKTYIIDEIKLTRRPGDVPYRPIETGEATAQITVQDWELGLNLGTIVI